MNILGSYELGTVLNDINAFSVIIRFAMALIFSAVLGIERTQKRRPAGLRTFMLVCTGAAAIMMTQQYLIKCGYSSDVARLPAQVISGIGFLGAGTIMTTRYYRVKGLTTAAALWGAACMGLCIGCGFYLAATVMFICFVAIMLLADRFEGFYTKRLRVLHLYVMLTNVESLKKFVQYIKSKDMEISDVETSKSDNRDGIAIFCLIHFHKPHTHEEVLKLVDEYEGTVFYEEVGD